MVVPPAPVRVPSQRSLAPSVMSLANDKGDNEKIPGAVHRSPGVFLKAEESPGKPHRVVHSINSFYGTTVENKGKLILTEIFPSVQRHDIF